MRPLQQQLQELLGPDRVLDTVDDREFYSSDIFSRDQLAALVIRPRSGDELAQAVAMITMAGYSVIGRGGGTSYTGGLLPDREESVMVDTSGLNRIIEINPDDMYVTAEAGVTWQQLHEALKDSDVRPPFWGPLSGSLATLGGALSQNSILWGSTAHGVSANSVQSLEVILADGSVLNTGAVAAGGKPFFRNFGPDLTGLFLGDCGALGIKSKVSLRLMKRPSEVRLASFNFPDRTQFSTAMAEIARSGQVATCFGMDPMLQYQRIRRASMGQGVKALKGVMTSGKSTFSGIKAAMKIAVAGKRFLDENGYSMHLVVEDVDSQSAEAKMAQARQICAAGGTEVENSVPTMMYSNPFVEMTSSIGPDGERWAPMHGLFPMSEADTSWARIEALFDEYTEDFDRLGIMPAYLLAVVSTTAFVVEPVLYWPAPRTTWHQRVLEPEQLRRYKDFPDNPEVNDTVSEVREKLTRLFSELGAAHLQIGKKYHYTEQLDPARLALLQAVKAAVDPEGLMNPGSLGLDSR